jgi:hypothetical protein
MRCVSAHRRGRRIRERRRNEPRALPRSRRALSNTPPLERRWFFQTRNPIPVQSQQQSQSPLLLLPAEIREAIFFEVVGGKLVHLLQLPRRLGHKCCNPGTSSDDTRWHRRRECISPEKRKTYWAGEPLVSEEDAKSDDRGLGLLLASRQTYRECIGLLYSTNTFDVNHPQTLVFLARTIRPHRLAAIRSLQITFPGNGLRLNIDDPRLEEPDDLKTWLAMCNLVTKMTGLKSLTLGLERTQSFLWMPYVVEVPREDVERLMQHLSALRGLDHFDLEVSPASWDVLEYTEELRSTFMLPRDSSSQ